MKLFYAVLATAMLALPGCATVMEGTDQDIPVRTEPAYAICDVMQKGHLVGSTGGTNNVLSIGKSREPLTVACSAPGYAPKQVHVVSGASGWGVVSFWFWDLAITDWITGGLNHYPGAIGVALAPVPGQEDLRRAALDEYTATPRSTNGFVSLNKVRPARQIPYAVYRN